MHSAVNSLRRFQSTSSQTRERNITTDSSLFSYLSFNPLPLKQEKETTENALKNDEPGAFQSTPSQTRGRNRTRNCLAVRFLVSIHSLSNKRKKLPGNGGMNIFGQFQSTSSQTRERNGRSLVGCLMCPWVSIHFLSNKRKKLPYGSLVDLILKVSIHFLSNKRKKLKSDYFKNKVGKVSIHSLSNKRKKLSPQFGRIRYALRFNPLPLKQEKETYYAKNQVGAIWFQSTPSQTRGRNLSQEIK
ncbi:hypothetical protein LEP1GSC041_2445 [Leptospira noguchii str. 2006001870]|nr:hypothetical protein LEP1GSC041_2445 [Leptospira noguchii str. 2006001870]